MRLCVFSGKCNEKGHVWCHCGLMSEDEWSETAKIISNHDIIVSQAAEVGIRTFKVIADAFRYESFSTINNHVKMFIQRKTVKVKSRSGPPPRLSARQERYLLPLARRKPRATWRELCLDMNVMLGHRQRSFSVNTALRSLCKRKIGHCCASKRILLIKDGLGVLMQYVA